MVWGLRLQGFGVEGCSKAKVDWSFNSTSLQLRVLSPISRPAVSAGSSKTSVVALIIRTGFGGCIIL